MRRQDGLSFFAHRSSTSDLSSNPRIPSSATCARARARDNGINCTAIDAMGAISASRFIDDLINSRGPSRVVRAYSISISAIILISRHDRHSTSKRAQRFGRSGYEEC
jgi:hypothetical protein